MIADCDHRFVADVADVDDGEVRATNRASLTVWDVNQRYQLAECMERDPRAGGYVLDNVRGRRRVSWLIRVTALREYW